MVKLVEYPESSDDEQDARSDGSQWSSFGEIPSSPSDSFSYHMRTPESEEEDEDYAPSQTSLEAAGSVTSSVDTDDLDPDNEMEEQPTVDVTREKKGVFYAWKDLKEAFQDNPFKRRSVETEGEEGNQQEDQGTAKPNLFDVEKGRWTFQAAFAPGVADKGPRRRHRSTRMTGVSPKFSSLFRGEQEAKEATLMEESGDKQDEAATTATMAAFSVPTVEIPVFGAKQTTSAPETPDFTFGKAGSATFSDDTHMQSPSPRRTASVPFVPADGGFTIGRSGKAPRPYNFAGHGGSSANKCSSKAPPAVKIDDGDDTRMISPSPQAKPASRTPTNGEFLFGQAYKNRKPFAFSRKNSNESFHSAGSASTSAAGPSWGSTVPVKNTSADRMDVKKEPTAASAFFKTGVPEPKTPHRSFGRRKKKINTASASVPPLKHNSSPSFFGAPSSDSVFGSSAFGAPETTHQQSNASFVSPTTPFDLAGDKVHENDARLSEAASPIPFNKPLAGCTGGSFVFGSSKAKSFREAGASPFQTRAFGSVSSAPVKPSTGASEQFMFGNGTSRHPYELGEVETNSQTGAANSNFPGRQADSMVISSTDGFHIGSTDVKKNARVRPRKSGMFTNKNTPRKDAKLGVNEPEPSPGFSSTTPSPFGMHNRRSRKNARIRQYGRSPPADPFVTPTFQTHPTSSPFVSFEGEVHPNVVRPTAKKGMSSVFGAPTASATAFGSGTAQQKDKTSEPGVFSFLSKQNLQHTSHSTVFGPNGSTQPAKSEQTNETAPRPAFAGSRRILRAALRNVGARGDHARSAPPTTGYHHTEGDAEMDSEDERDWEELKRLGGVAHCSRKYEEAAEYYRQSIEVLESLLYHGTISDTRITRTDKAKLHANRAASLMMLMRITEAQQECRRSIEVDATYARAYLRLGRIQVQLGDTAHAQANLDTARHLMEGQSGEIRNGDQADHASLLKMEATVKKLMMLQGEIKWYVDCGDFKHALVHTESALALAPSSRKLQVQKGRILLHQREFDQLVQFCTSIIEKQQTPQKKLSSPGSRDGVKTKSLRNKTVEKIAFIGIDLGLLWATTLHYQNKVEDAVQILNALEVVAPCSSHVIQLKQQWQEMKQLKHDGNERFKRGEYQAAVRAYSEAVQIDPQHQEFCAIIYCNRAAAQMGLERYHTAILDCNEALQRKPNYPRALLRRARCHVALKMHHEAVKDFDKYLREQPGDVPIDATADVRRERNEAKAAIAKAREEARQREAAKKRAEREQRQRCQHRWEDTSWNNSKFYGNFRRTSSNNSNGSSYGNSRYQSSGAGGRASFMAPKTQRRTHYDVLGIEKTSTVDQIKKAYRKLALVYHPDKAKTSIHAELFKEMTAAYNILSDEGARAKYDRELIYNRFGNFYEN